MPRVHSVKKARKDIPGTDIKKGDSYYWWKFRYGPKRVSKTYPTRGQLTQSSFLQQMYRIEDGLQAVTPDDDFQSIIDDVGSELNSLKDEVQDSLDNMPEQLQSGPTGEMLQSRIDAVEEMINELEDIDIDIEGSVDTDIDIEREKDETDEDYEERVKERKQEIEDEIEDKKDEMANEISSIQYSGE